MKDEYTNTFFDIVRETQEVHGLDLPVELESYVVFLLADHIDKPDFMPSKTFAECYLRLQRPYDKNAKQLGDTCLFITGVFPSYGARKGLDVSYYTNIGKSSYNIASECLNSELFDSLSTHFVFLRDFIDISINNQKVHSILR
tara:strand:+ start:405 stop:833 length:429 start_codon:yes stop_codon:yes gene_type:complete